jgi:hypothetical protein
MTHKLVSDVLPRQNKLILESDQTEHRWQQIAEVIGTDNRAELDDAEEVASYRRLYRVLGEIELPEPPEHYPQDIERYVRVQLETTQIDRPDWAVRCSLVLLCLVAFLAAAYLPTSAWQRWALAPGKALWHVLAAGVAAIALFHFLEIRAARRQLRKTH